MLDVIEVFLYGAIWAVYVAIVVFVFAQLIQSTATMIRNKRIKNRQRIAAYEKRVIKNRDITFSECLRYGK